MKVESFHRAAAAFFGLACSNAARAGLLTVPVLFAFVALLAEPCKSMPPLQTEGARAQHPIFGTWSLGDGTNGHTELTVFMPDGTFRDVSTNRWAGGMKTFRYRGTWEVQSNTLTLRLTYTTEPVAQPVGTILRYNILRLDSEALTLGDSLLTNTFRRVRRPRSGAHETKP